MDENIGCTVIDSHVHISSFPFICVLGKKGGNPYYAEEFENVYLFRPTFEKFESNYGSIVDGACIFSIVQDIYDRRNPDFKDDAVWKAHRQAANRRLLEIARSKKDMKIFPYYFVWNDFDVDELKRSIEKRHNQGYWVGAPWGCEGHGFNLFERMQWLRGVETFFMDLIEYRDKVEELAEMCKGKMCILTDVDRQHLLPYGKPSEVKEYVRNMIETLAAPDGGLILRGSVESITPLENVKAMYEAFWEYGKNYKQL